MNQEAVDYTNELTNACMRVGHTLRESEVAKSLARNYGYGLASCGAIEKEMREFCRETYGGMLVRATGLQPPFDMRDWASQICIGYEQFGHDQFIKACESSHP